MAGNKKSKVSSQFTLSQKLFFFLLSFNFHFTVDKGKNGIQNSSAMGIQALRHGNRRGWKRPCFRFAFPFSFFHSPNVFLFLLTYFGIRFRTHGLWLLILCSVLYENPSHIEFCRYHTMPNCYYFVLYIIYYWKDFFKIC